ncbi:hypothetical protein G6F47_011384 [Rhizopus delemar]|nr:hypothetical protein G6F43_011014 [Rhizopus delemar]KAG1487637.1 hypothetical protein G6F54_012535 [Rhizopus delemar]KAG1554541.1 hypothetical protein G6F50_012981 [Rhizopus delemar]KAG1585870.1 hypothetical protein G6F47_011384 [Rhizopus delemar]KAG1613434.1 hypothetical protein G6F45_012796 [Rhizopus arrhizus]
MIGTTRFQLGEVRLQAICDELKLVHKDNSSYYNADGIIINNKHKIEIAAVETTGPFHLSNNSKETQDYIKADYGLVSMLHCIGRKFPYGNFDIFKRIGVFFIQVTGIHQVENLASIDATQQVVHQKLYRLGWSANNSKNQRGKFEKISQFVLVHEENDSRNVRSNRRFRRFSYQQHEVKD